jgi:ATP-dependent RNA helicase DHX37/DHR1
MIGITQPRRVAAVSMAKRVQEEMGLYNGEVSYQIRYDKDKMGKNTRIKFMTDGILLRELSNLVDSKAKGDLLLSQYSCIIIDEAHERTVGTDILIGWLTRIVKLRNSGKIKGIGPLKLVIMSATLRVEDFVENETLFPECDGKPPVVKVEGRQHKVIVHYNKKTPELGYIEEVLKKIVKIHTKLPYGGVLVFVTGQQEVSILVKKLQNIFPEIKNTIDKVESNQGGLFDNDFDDQVEENDDDYDDVNLSSSDDEEEITQTLSGTVEEDEDIKEEVKEVETRMKTPVHVLPLFSMLSTQDQMKVFQPPPENHRMIIIATNVAETSLTIPGIKYVIDAGKVKSRSYDTQTGLENFSIGWTSKASADQRAGRAGRTGKGHCYRLFSSAVYEEYFEKFTKPEILRVPIEGVVLNMKSMGILKIVGFPFPTMPDQFGLKDAEKLLVHLNAIDKDGKITQHGMMMSKFPVVPRLSRVIVEGLGSPLMGYILMMVAGLSVGDIFYRDLDLLIDKKPVKDENGDIVENEESDDDREERKEKRGSFYKKMQVN